MTRAAQQLIQTFEALPVQDRQEVLVELLRMPLEAGYPAPSDEELLSSADEIFRGYDEREAQD
jgi:hypothetical protein